MSYFITRRYYDRPDRPQPVYKGAVNLWESWLYVPITDATRNSWRPPSRLGDPAGLLQTAPSQAWIPTTVDRVVATWVPSFDADYRYRSPDGIRLDVRRYDWNPQFGWVGKAADITIASWSPAFADLELGSIGFRTPIRPLLDVRGYDWSPSFAWVSKVIDAVVGSWAPVFDAVPRFRSPDHLLLDVRRYEWTQPAWIFSSIPATSTVAQQWPAILLNLPISYRSPERRVFDVRGYQQSPFFKWPFTPGAPRVVTFVSYVTGSSFASYSVSTVAFESWGVGVVTFTSTDG